MGIEIKMPSQEEFDQVADQYKRALLEYAVSATSRGADLRDIQDRSAERIHHLAAFVRGDKKRIALQDTYVDDWDANAVGSLYDILESFIKNVVADIPFSEQARSAITGEEQAKLVEDILREGE